MPTSLGAGAPGHCWRPYYGDVLYSFHYNGITRLMLTPAGKERDCEAAEEEETEEAEEEGRSRHFSWACCDEAGGHGMSSVMSSC